MKTNEKGKKKTEKTKDSQQGALSQRRGTEQELKSDKKKWGSVLLLLTGISGVDYSCRLSQRRVCGT
jgi:hypothetical protein